MKGLLTLGVPLGIVALGMIGLFIATIIQEEFLMDP